MIIAFLLLDFFGPLALLRLRQSSTVSAAWWDDSWSFRKPVNITNASGGALTDFQVSFTIDTTDTTRFQTTCNDIRVTDINGKLLPHWNHPSYPCGTSTTKYYVKVPSLPTSGITLYVYYGNPTAPNIENGNNVFDFFDGFSGTALDTSKWNTTGTSSNGTVSILNGFVRLYNTQNENDILKSNSSFNQQNYVLESRLKMLSGASGDLDSQIGWESGAKSGIGPQDNAWEKPHQIINPAVVQGTELITSSWKEWYLVAKSGVVKSYFNGESLTTATANASTTSSLYFLSNVANDSLDIDFVALRKYASTEPTSALTAEQTGTGPVAYWKFDEGQGGTAYDSTSNKLNGVLGATTAAPTWQAEDKCITGKCLKFDGSNDLVTVDDNSNLDFGTSDFTIETWVKNYQTGTFDTHVISKKAGENNTTVGWVASLDNRSPGTVSLRFNDGTSLGDSTPYATGNLSSLFTDNTWRHVAWVISRSANTVTFYVDGVSRGSGSLGSHPGTISNSQALTIGGSPQIKINAGIDEPKIYPYARSLAQIKSDYASGLAHASADEGSNAVLGSASNNALTLNNGLVGYWKMDEATWSGTANEAVDSSGNGNNGAAAGPANDKPYTLGGKFGNGGKFDGINDYVSAGNPSTINTATNITISAWVKTNSTNLTFANGTIAGNQARFFLSLSDYSSSTPRATGYVRNEAGTWGYIKGNTAINDNQWHLVTMTYDGANIRVYHNGSIDASPYPFAGNLSSASNLYIGAYSTGAGYFSNTSIDEVRIYNRALSPSEISQLYNWAPGPIGYYNFDEGSGTIANDSGTNAINATVSVNDWTTGKFGKGIKKGSNINLSDQPKLEGLFQITAELWIYPTLLAGTDREIFKKGVWTDADMSYRLMYQTDWGSGTGYPLGYWKFHIKHDGDNECNATGPNGDSASRTNMWHHIAGTWDGLTIKVYDDGILIGSAACVGTIINTNTYDTYLNYGMPGILDDLKIYNYARNSKQIVEDMNGGHPAGGSPVGSQVGYWNFDEGQGGTAHDSGSNSLSGTLSGATWLNDGKFGKAIVFNNDTDKISIADTTSSPLDITSDFTLSAWIYRSGTATLQARIVDKGDRYALYLNSANKLQCYSSAVSPATELTSTNIIPVNTWTYVACTYTNGSRKLYINGKVEISDTPTGPANTDNTELTIGNYTTAGTNYRFRGVIDEVKIYNSALTADEIKIDYNQGNALSLGTLGTSITDGKTASNSATSQYCVPGDTGTCRAPVTEWLMDEGQGGYANDTSGNNNLGTWYGTGTTHYVPGKYGKAGNFNGTDDRITTNGNVGDNISAITVSAWVYSKTGTYASGFVAKDDVGSARSWYFGMNDSTSFKVALWTTVTGRTDTSMAGFNLNQWTHVAFTYDGAKVILYKNGVPISTPTNQTGNIVNNPTTILTIGSLNASYLFQGMVDQVRVYDYARTPAQVAYDYNRGGPVGYWAFDECQGNTLNDTNPGTNTNNGTLNIGATVPQSVIGTCTTPTDGTGAWYNGKDGKYSSAMSFDGVDDYAIVNSSNYKFSSGDFSASVWAIKTDTGYGGLITTDSSGDVAWKIFIDNGHTYFSARYGTKILDFLPVNLVDWHHYVITKAGTTLSLYQDGKLVISDTCPATYAGGSSNMVFGSYRVDDALAAQNMFKGYIDDVQIFNYALTPLQIQQLYNQNAGVRFGPATGNP